MVYKDMDYDHKITYDFPSSFGSVIQNKLAVQSEMERSKIH